MAIIIVWFLVVCCVRCTRCKNRDQNRPQSDKINWMVCMFVCILWRRWRLFAAKQPKEIILNLHFSCLIFSLNMSKYLNITLKWMIAATMLSQHANYNLKQNNNKIKMKARARLKRAINHLTEAKLIEIHSQNRNDQIRVMRSVLHAKTLTKSVIGIISTIISANSFGSMIL